jgi:hypothetical protein
MPSIADAAAQLRADNHPVLFLDTCVIVDIIRATVSSAPRTLTTTAILILTWPRISWPSVSRSPPIFPGPPRDSNLTGWSLRSLTAIPSACSAIASCRITGPLTSDWRPTARSRGGKGVRRALMPPNGSRGDVTRWRRCRAVLSHLFQRRGTGMSAR